MKGDMQVELLYFDGCPGYESLLPRLKELLADHAPDATFQLRAIESLEAADEHRFLGSPSVRVNGRDVEPGAGARQDFGLTCRLYTRPDGRTREPPDEWILDALGSGSRGG
jgi:hypothetical protein